MGAVKRTHKKSVLKNKLRKKALRYMNQAYSESFSKKVWLKEYRAIFEKYLIRSEETTEGAIRQTYSQEGK